MNTLAIVCATLALGQSATETPLKLDAGKDAVRAALFRPKGAGPFPAVLVIHGDFGLTPWVKQQARRLAERGYLALAVDFYEGELPTTIEEAHILERGLEERRVLAHLKAAVDYLVQHKDATSGAIGVIGWEAGGGYALDLAMADRRVKATVLCYGRVATDTKRLAALQGPVLALFGGKDEGIAPETIEQFRKAVASAGKTATIHVYPKCGAGFMDPNSPLRDGEVDRAAIADAWTRIEAHFSRLPVSGIAPRTR